MYRPDVRDTDDRSRERGGRTDDGVCHDDIRAQSPKNPGKRAGVPAVPGELMSQPTRSRGRAHPPPNAGDRDLGPDPLESRPQRALLRNDDVEIGDKTCTEGVHELAERELGAASRIRAV